MSIMIGNFDESIRMSEVSTGKASAFVQRYREAGEDWRVEAKLG